MPSIYDLLIIGGGIHGLATASLAAANGLKVILIEKNDLASATSSASSKLIHGGLRYLEQGEFGLVRQSIQARQHLLKLAPHLVHPLAFVLPLTALSRPKWQIRLGLACYDFFARHDAFSPSRFLSSGIDSHYFSALKPSIQQAGLYFDAQAEDTRLTIENALQAKQQGAEIYTHTSLETAKVIQNHWHLTLQSKNKHIHMIQAKAIVNTAGPWVNEVHQILGTPNVPVIRWIKGSHIVLPPLYAGKHAYILQQADKRVVFCIPYHGYTLVGTTDVTIDQNDSAIQITQAEIDYLFNSISQYFRSTLSLKDIRYHWSGVRTCLDEASTASQELSRNTSIHYSAHPAPVVSLYGGKLTTHQSTAQKLLNGLSTHFSNLRMNALELTPFPGAKTPGEHSYASYIHQLSQHFSWVPHLLLKRYIALYGTRIVKLLKNCHQLSDLGKPIAADVYPREIDFLCKEEWAISAEDILWRRTKLGLTLSMQEQEKVKAFMVTLSSI